MPICNPAGGKCNQELGHEGDHGFAIGGGFLIAPWPNVGPTLVEQIVDLGCDICGEPMRMAKGADGGSFTCTSESCDQTHTFKRDGTWTYVVLGKLFPSRYKGAHEMPDAMQQDFIAYRLSQGLFHTEAMFLLELIDQEERQRQRGQAQEGVRLFWEEKAKREREAERCSDSESQLRQSWWSRALHWGRSRLKRS